MGEVNWYPGLTTIQVAKTSIYQQLVNILLATCRYFVED